MKKLLLVLYVCTNINSVHSMHRLNDTAVKVSQHGGGARLIGFLTAALLTYVFREDVHKYIDAKSSLAQAQAAEIRARLPKP